MRPIRVLAIDWSGAVAGAKRKIQLAEARDSVLVRIEGGRDRESLSDHLVDMAARDPRMIVGLDFAFSFPRWFVDTFGGGSAQSTWKRLAEGDAERILRECAPPFWGRPGKRRPPDTVEFRTADSDVGSVGGIRPKSVFQIGGAGAVGTGSIRGMPILHKLRSAGFRVWPFDPPGFPLVVEIYPRVLTGPVHKGRREERILYMRGRHSDLEPAMFDRAVASEDAFDAAVSCLVMAKHRAELETLPDLDDLQSRIEGRIWRPRE